MLRSLYLSHRIINMQNSSLIVSRSDFISSLFVGKQVLVYNGKLYREVLITNDMVGSKFGEFSWTRKMNHFDRFKKVKKKLTRK